ncbi:TPA: hypothetical protein ACH3X2_011893 [Trebouxia sp. C0005]
MYIPLQQASACLNASVWLEQAWVDTLKWKALLTGHDMQGVSSQGVSVLFVIQQPFLWTRFPGSLKVSYITAKAGVLTCLISLLLVWQQQHTHTQSPPHLVSVTHTKIAFSYAVSKIARSTLI